MARYNPGQVSDPVMTAELAKIAQAIETADSQINLDKLYAAPKKYRVGTVIFADGATFNPGSGEGLYVYRTGGWKFLG